jgi:condensin complex subunit 3
MPGVVVTNPAKTIRQIFQESQKSAATHRKLVNSLRTVQTTCTQQDNEDAFNEQFIRCLNRVLPVKKSEPTADRVVKFVGHFIQHVQDKSCLCKEFWLTVVVKEETEDGEEAEETEESLAAGRFVEMFLRHLLRGIDAKEKFVRLRVCQLIALAMNSLGEIEYHPNLTRVIVAMTSSTI